MNSNEINEINERKQNIKSRVFFFKKFEAIYEIEPRRFKTITEFWKRFWLKTDDNVNKFFKISYAEPQYKTKYRVNKMEEYLNEVADEFNGRMM